MSTTRIALVTGANRGIGAAIAAGLAAQGMTVVAGSRGGGPGTLRLDVTDDDSVRDAVAEVAGRYGRLDVLVNNAGISGGIDGQVSGEIDPEVMRTVFETNLFGVVRVTEAFLPLLRKGDGGRIINVSSGTASLTWQSDPGHAFASGRLPLAYPASKAALNMVTVMYAKTLASEGITVNAVAPGACGTDFATDLGLSLERTAEQGAAIVLHLATVAESPTGTFVQDDGPVPW
ncbi:SDR family NAD(P)-dependent oxidoreductase [Actinoplanes sp. NPDC051851]|uniref:SDR family NAD(P)-dependent oxidoreductase n=1 Tax=Actinoplanes sp. NPDC051851 TaxID=3154753 RepID=UPI00343D3E48